MSEILALMPISTFEVKYGGRYWIRTSDLSNVNRTL